MRRQGSSSCLAPHIAVKLEHGTCFNIHTVSEAAALVQVAGKLMMHQLAHLGTKNLSMGIDAERASVGELTPQQLCIAATTAFNRGVEVIFIPASLLQEPPRM
jgi:hypothetical protein